MKQFLWNREKNDRLKRERGISFDDIVRHIGRGQLLAVIDHPDPSKHKGQRIYVVDVGGYARLVPFVEDRRWIFLKTIIPSRKATKHYLGAMGAK